MILGAHESIGGSYLRAIEDGLADGCESIQIFTKNQTQWREPEVDEARFEDFRRERRKAKIRFVMSHTSYLINLATDNPETLRRSIEALEHELRRCEKLGIEYLVMHPGAHVGQGEEKGLALIAAGIGGVLEQFKDAGTRILLETTAGQGSTLCRSFEQIAWLLERTPGGGRMGVCFDTAHAYAAGYDIKSAAGYKKTFDEFDGVIGLEKLLAFHLNDSKKDIGTRVDRHEHIGKGFLGPEPFRRLLKDRRFAKIPAILETPPLPGGDRGYRQNLAVLRKLAR
jgi:deoxyribonuclease-4